ncbi:MAG: hypothetical protein GC154_06775 [bacterium]|nr:hypothetical protein [bacterium]
MIRFRIAAIALIASFALSASSAPEATQSPHPGVQVDCTFCHKCLNPTKDDPCLLPCPRLKSEVLPLSKMGPKMVELNQLQDVEDLYVPVLFNHETHAHMSSTAQGCQMCHHYNEESPQPAACASCHPKDIIHENLKQPGLKGAYHRQCIGCHTQWDPNTECVFCHEKKAGGKLNGTATQAAYEKKYKVVPFRELIVYKSEDVEPVPFHHKTHAYRYDRNCGDCHADQGCDACHDPTKTEIKPMGDLTPDQMHDRCFVCHGDDDCEHCHGRSEDDVFVHEKRVDFVLKPFHQALHCRDCHTTSGAFTKLNPSCTACHASGWKAEGFNHALTGVALDEVHVEAGCTDCHEDSMTEKDGMLIASSGKVTASCAGCHDDGRSYDPKKGFTASE